MFFPISVVQYGLGPGICIFSSALPPTHTVILLCTGVLRAPPFLLLPGSHPTPTQEPQASVEPRFMRVAISLAV